jgi:hypothetical protein
MRLHGGFFIIRRLIRRKEENVGDKLTAAIMAYAETQKKVLDRIFDNIERTERPSSPDLACCLPDGVIASLPDGEDRYAAFLRKKRFLGYAQWKSTCYHQAKQHASFTAEREDLLAHFPALEARFQQELAEGKGAPMPVVEQHTPSAILRADVEDNGCTFFVLSTECLTDAKRDDAGDEPDEARQGGA